MATQYSKQLKWGRSMTGQQINPLLIARLTGKNIDDISKMPTIHSLPGKYARMIYKKRNMIEDSFQSNYFLLICKTCGKKGKYNVGKMFMNAIKKMKKDPLNSIQTTAYFRCKHCNDAGNWEMPRDFLMTAMTALAAKSGGIEDMEDRCDIGTLQLHDGSSFLYTSQSEEHLLNQLPGNHDDAYIWNRIANIYNMGSRPELAACALEHSLTIEPEQTESHYTLGSLLFEIREYEKAIYHYKQMLLSANKYTLMKAGNLRSILANGLQDLAMIHSQTEGKIAFLPLKEEVQVMLQAKEVSEYQYQLVPEDTTSFYPLAEMYMERSQVKKIPKKQRTL